MRHGKKFNHLSRKRGHRKAMLSNMACSLIEHKRINTTLAKAKALRVYVEPLITKSKDDTTHSRRTAFRYLRDKMAVNELFREIAPKIAERPGGYTRIIRLGNRLGDNAEMCMIELVDFNELLLSTDGDAKKTRRSRRGRGGKSKSTDLETQASSNASQKSDETTTEAKAEVKAEKSEEKKTEDAPKAETKEETPKSEKKDETPKADKKEEAPKSEAKEEAPKKDAEPKAEKKADDSKEENTEDKKEDK